MNPRDYLVQYGRPAFVGRFAHAAGGEFARGDRVLIDSPRGHEIGEVLCPGGFGVRQGELVRAAEDADALDVSAVEADLLAAVEAAVAGSPVTLIDAEILPGGDGILHALPWGECDLTPALDAARVQFQLASLKLFDVSRTPVIPDPPTTCGKLGCGTSAGGCDSCSSGSCGTSSCSKGAAKSANELTAYFADLRKQMEATTARTPLN